MPLECSPLSIPQQTRSMACLLQVRAPAVAVANLSPNARNLSAPCRKLLSCTAAAQKRLNLSHKHSRGTISLVARRPYRQRVEFALRGLHGILGYARARFAHSPASEAIHGGHCLRNCAIGVADVKVCKRMPAAWVSCLHLKCSMQADLIADSRRRSFPTACANLVLEQIPRF